MGWGPVGVLFWGMDARWERTGYQREVGVVLPYIKDTHGYTRFKEGNSKANKILTHVLTIIDTMEVCVSIKTR